jgi:Cu/Ag efflux protein CusF
LFAFCTRKLRRRRFFRGQRGRDHAPLKNLGMPKMTMVFRVKDPAMLDRLKEGDKILFVADNVNGAFTLMSFEPMK